MEVIIKKQFLKDLKKCPKFVIDETTAFLEEIRNASQIYDLKGDIRPLLPDKTYYRLRIGDYRLGYRHVQPTIIVLTVLHRSEIYKFFPPR